MSTNQPTHHDLFHHKHGWAFSGSTIANYVYGVHAWHVLHGLEWAIIPLKLEALLKGADCLTPGTSKRKKWQPYTQSSYKECVTTCS